MAAWVSPRDCRWQRLKLLMRYCFRFSFKTNCRCFKHKQIFAPKVEKTFFEKKGYTLDVMAMSKFTSRFNSTLLQKLGKIIWKKHFSYFDGSDTDLSAFSIPHIRFTLTDLKKTNEWEMISTGSKNHIITFLDHSNNALHLNKSFENVSGCQGDQTIYPSYPGGSQIHLRKTIGSWEWQIVSVRVKQAPKSTWIFSYQ